MLICLISCQDNERNENPVSSEKHENTSVKNVADNEENKKSAAPQINSPSTSTTKPETTDSISLTGLYHKTDENPTSSCNCYCLDIHLSGTSELCIEEDALYINARFQKDGDHINVYYDGISSKTVETDIPWDKFEYGTPIAVINSTNNSALELDWKGFSIGNQIAVDYALIGKKALEGTYKKQ